VLLVAVSRLLTSYHLRAAINFASVATPTCLELAKGIVPSYYSPCCFCAILLHMLVQLNELHPDCILPDLF
jgi:hypothetical protein